MNIKKIADIAGVSTATVSHVINDTKNVTPEVRERVSKIVFETGYRPNHIAKSLRKSSTNTIGVVVEDILGFPVPFIINGISEFAEEQGFQIVLNDLRILDKVYNQYSQIIVYKNKINDAISFLLQSAMVDAIIYVGLFDRDVTGIVNNIKKPLVFSYCITQNDEDFYVTYDSENVSFEAVRYLIEMGHVHTAIITGLKDTFPCNMRLNGISRAFKEAGLSLDFDMIRWGDWEYDSGFKAASSLLDLCNPPTAIFAMNDIMAAGAIDAVVARGLSVPFDVSVIGFDNREFSSYIRPNLTTSHINLKEIGRTAAKITIGRIKGEDISQRHYIIPSQLLKRDSVISLHK